MTGAVDGARPASDAPLLLYEKWSLATARHARAQYAHERTAHHWPHVSPSWLDHSTGMQPGRFAARGGTVPRVVGVMTIPSNRSRLVALGVLAVGGMALAAGAAGAAGGDAGQQLGRACPPAEPSVHWRVRRLAGPVNRDLSPAVAMGPAGQTLVVWQGRQGVEGAVRVRPGLAWRPISVGEGRAGSLAAGYDATGRAVVAWQGPGVSVVTVARDGSVGRPRRFARMGGAPAVAVGARGEAVLAWTEGHDVKAAYRKAGGTFGRAETVLRGHALRGGGALSVAVNRSGFATVLVEGRLEGSGTAIIAVTRSPAGHWDGGQTIAAGGPDRRLFGAPVGASSRGTVVAWSEAQAGSARILSSQRVPFGAFGSPFAISPPGASVARSVAPALAVGAGGPVIAAWVQRAPRVGIVMAATRGTGSPGTMRYPVDTVRYPPGTVRARIDGLSAASAPNGAAAIAWLVHCGRRAGSHVLVAIRTAHRHFQPAEVVASASSRAPILAIARCGRPVPVVAWVVFAHYRASVMYADRGTRCRP